MGEDYSLSRYWLAKTAHRECQSATALPLAHTQKLLAVLIADSGEAPKAFLTNALGIMQSQ